MPLEGVHNQVKISTVALLIIMPVKGFLKGKMLKLLLILLYKTYKQVWQEKRLIPFHEYMNKCLNYVL